MNNKRLFFDIETSYEIGWFWRAGRKQFINASQVFEEGKIICICWKWEGEDEVHSLDWGKNQCDKKMLTKFMKVMESASEVIAHNGDNFDIKWLRTRCLKHRIPAFPKYNSLDTWKSSKSAFNMDSHSLNEMAKFLGLGKKMDTGGIDLWHDIIKNKDKQALEVMIEYCKKDVILLEKVFNEIKNYIGHKTNFAAIKHGDKTKKFEKFQCPECSSFNVKLKSTFATAMGTPRRNLCCKECKKVFTVSNKTYMDYLKFKIKNNIK